MTEMKFEGAIDASVIVKAGVYVLCWRGSVVYVGQSKACLSRIYTHKSNRGKSTPSWLPVKGITFDEVHIIPLSEPVDRDDVERRMIAQYRPKFNTVHKPSAHNRAPISLRIGSRDFTFNPKPIERRC